MLDMVQRPASIVCTSHFGGNLTSVLLASGYRTSTADELLRASVQYVAGIAGHLDGSV